MRPATATPSVSVIPSATPTAPIMPAVVTVTAPVGSVVPTAEAPSVAVGVIRVARVAVVTAKPGGTRRCAIVAAVIDHLGISRAPRDKQRPQAADKTRSVFTLFPFRRGEQRARSMAGNVYSTKQAGSLASSAGGCKPPERQIWTPRIAYCRAELKIGQNIRA
jgi:hypothetical protein